ncbi:gamma-glutamylcyclotransferase [Paracoccus sp. (in: a-proteobacteria)]|uniref:gamma-glutamylcyclotransferase n=1 Tax=Paracoccus sp. TaxID=267 RepID=UPI002897B200|nr:gamma-glutamylcyclotransferase [Paracoccus sp. (in: a-proteobacteria)]
MQKEPEFWVFAYGSLMWDPGFPVAECVTARIDGFVRRFCMQSVVYRGTQERPGLVLALDEDKGGHCTGLALRVAAQDWPQTLHDMRQRELATNAYREDVRGVLLADGRRVQAVTYVMRREHDQYVGDVSLAEQARIIASAVGGRGPNADYLFNTTHHLSQIGLEDLMLEDLARQVRQLLSASH